MDLLNEGSRTAPESNPADSIGREYATIKSAAAMCLLDHRLIVRVTGDDRVSFLHGMCSADIKGLRPGALTPGLFLTEHAHVIADFLAYETGDGAFLIEIDRAAWPRTRAHLEKFLVADDVEIEEAHGLALLDIEGPRSFEMLKTVCGGMAEMPAPLRHIAIDDLRIANLPRNGGPASTVIAQRPRLTSLMEDLQARGVGDVSAQTLDIIRIEHGIARVGVDTTEKTIALEARLEPAISFNKGCYVGQETVERATARGNLKKRMWGLRIGGQRIPQVGAAILLDRHEVGHLSSVAASPALGTIGLAIVHHSAWSDGARVVIVDGTGETPATISDLPLR
ncbi:MAG TPA: glycine cleavage T C-terminal barrel domain-containing protein [Candidatus Binataceae bacterium]|nr:glycine cleavage T C-terminal barrel domain-containing protein [Candidatus Binataceae bacterium]